MWATSSRPGLDISSRVGDVLWRAWRITSGHSGRRRLPWMRLFKTGDGYARGGELSTPSGVAQLPLRFSSPEMADRPTRSAAYELLVAALCGAVAV